MSVSSGSLTVNSAFRPNISSVTVVPLFSSVWSPISMIDMAFSLAKTASAVLSKASSRRIFRAFAARLEFRRARVANLAGFPQFRTDMPNLVGDDPDAVLRVRFRGVPNGDAPRRGGFAEGGVTTASGRADAGPFSEQCRGCIRVRRSWPARLTHRLYGDIPGPPQAGAGFRAERGRPDMSRAGARTCFTHAKDLHFLRVKARKL